MEKHVIQGPPGCGKTWALAEVWIPKAARRFGAERLVVCSLTRAAAAEIAGRVEAKGLEIPREQVGTLHSLLWRAADRPEILGTRHIRSWNEQSPVWHVSPKIAATRRGEDAETDGYGGLSLIGDELHTQAELLLARRVEPARWPEPVRDFYDAWQAWKERENVCEFTDLPLMALREGWPCPGRPQVLFVDEAQDYSALEMALIDLWGRSCSYYVVAGDPNQCQPAGTMVLMEGGWSKPIEYVRAGDRVVSYHTGSSDLRGLRSQGRRVEEASVRPYMGRMLTLRVGEHETRCTPEHRVLTRMRKGGFYCLYLMRRGERFRVGVCASKYRHGFGVSMRARQEGADAMWLLGCYRTQREVLFAEAWTQATFGLPGQVFANRGGKCFWSQRDLDRLHRSLDTRSGAASCLRHYGRREEFPVWSAGNAHRQISVKSFVTQASNLVPGFFEMRTISGWAPVEVSEHQTVEPVYSLKVQATEGGKRLYVADGVVVHNSIFTFRGADPTVMMEGATKVWPLSQSYRCPAPVSSYAEGLLSHARVAYPVSYAPADHAGSVSWGGSQDLSTAATEALGGAGSAMLVASCHYQLPVAELKRTGVPFHNPFNPSDASTNPLGLRSRAGPAQRLRALLAPRFPQLVGSTHTRSWTFRELFAWTQYLEASGTFRHGAKAAIEKGAKSKANANRPVTPEEFVDLFTDPSALRHDSPASLLEWFAERLLKSRHTSFEYAREVARRDPAELWREPRLIVGTVHGVKGGEADRVVLYTGLSSAAAAGALEDPDPVVRLLYVGATRARHDLTLLGASGSDRDGLAWVGGPP